MVSPPDAKSDRDDPPIWVQSLRPTKLLDPRLVNLFQIAKFLHQDARFTSPRPAKSSKIDSFNFFAPQIRIKRLAKRWASSRTLCNSLRAGSNRHFQLVSFVWKNHRLFPFRQADEGYRIKIEQKEMIFWQKSLARVPRPPPLSLGICLPRPILHIYD